MNRTWKVSLAVLLAVGVASPAFAATICGVVRNTQGQPVPGAQVTVKDTSGAVLGQGTSGSDGGYTIGNIEPGQIDLFLDMTGMAYKPGSGVLHLTEASNAVNWEVSAGSAALAASSGTCDVAGAWSNAEIGSVVVLGGALAAAGGVTAWALSSNLEDNHVTSPQQ
jgi:Carboxypeptidase regulatory-like domain